MFRSLFLISLIVSLVVVSAIAVTPASGVSNQNQTIPTRTRPPPRPTDDDNGDDDDDPKPPPAPTGEATLTTTPTSTALSVTLAPTPEGGYLSTAAPCDAAPTVQTLGLTNVRAGPGTSYDTIAKLVFLEVRPIIGRAEFSDWWLVELADENTGWVFDQAVLVQGYTGYVPIAEAPELEDESDTPTPGPAWNPTPNPICTPPPSPTPTLTAEKFPTLVPIARDTDQPTILPTKTSTTTATKTSTPIKTSTTEPEKETSTPGSTMTPFPRPTLESPESNGFDVSWILFAGIGLVIIGGIWLFLQRRGGQ